MSPLADVLVAVVAVAALAAVETALVELPHAASANAVKLAALAPPAIFRKRLRSTSSRTRRSTTPIGRGSCSSPRPAAACSVGGPDIVVTSASALFCVLYAPRCGADQ